MHFEGILVRVLGIDGKGGFPKIEEEGLSGGKEEVGVGVGRLSEVTEERGEGKPLRKNAAT